MLKIEVEIKLGSSIDEACQELAELAGRMKIEVATKFNGVRLIAAKDATPQKIMAQYQAYCAAEILRDRPVAATDNPSCSGGECRLNSDQGFGPVD
jgi:hypothetical protein